MDVRHPIAVPAAPHPPTQPAESDPQAQHGAVPAVAGPSLSVLCLLSRDEARRRVEELLAVVRLKVDMDAEPEWVRKAYVEGQDLLRRLA